MTFLDKTGLSYLWSKLNAALNTALAGKADVTSLPTKISELQNDSGYLTSVPSEYVTDSELTAKGYLTSYTETDPTVPSWAKAASKPTYTASEIAAGTFKGQVVANASAQTPATLLLRNSKLVTAETNPSNNGEICWLYE